MKKVFISQPMNGKTDDEILADQFVVVTIMDTIGVVVALVGVHLKSKTQSTNIFQTTTFNMSESLLMSNEELRTNATR